jgi:hypothetical protein
LKIDIKNSQNKKNVEQLEKVKYGNLTKYRWTWGRAIELKTWVNDFLVKTSWSEITLPKLAEMQERTNFIIFVGQRDSKGP